MKRQAIGRMQLEMSRFFNLDSAQEQARGEGGSRRRRPTTRMGTRELRTVPSMLRRGGSTLTSPPRGRWSLGHCSVLSRLPDFGIQSIEKFARLFRWTASVLSLDWFEHDSSVYSSRSPCYGTADSPVYLSREMLEFHGNRQSDCDCAMYIHL